jgi:hypothetical protein
MDVQHGIDDAQTIFSTLILADHAWIHGPQTFFYPQTKPRRRRQIPSGDEPAGARLRANPTTLPQTAAATRTEDNMVSMQVADIPTVEAVEGARPNASRRTPLSGEKSVLDHRSLHQISRRRTFLQMARWPQARSTISDDVWVDVPWWPPPAMRALGSSVLVRMEEAGIAAYIYTYTPKRHVRMHISARDYGPKYFR